MYYGNGNFCSNDGVRTIGLINLVTERLDHFGRTTEAKHLTEQNAWTKDYDWR